MPAKIKPVQTAKTERLPFTQVLEGYLLETSAVEEHLLPIRTANETKAPVPSDMFIIPCMDTSIR